MEVFGPPGFFVYLTLVLIALVGYGLWRSTQSAAVPVQGTQSYAPVLPSTSAVLMDMAQELYAEAAEDAAEEGEPGADAPSPAQ